MKVKAKEVLSQQQFRQKAPILEGIDPKELEHIKNDDMASAKGLSELEATFEVYEQPRRLRLIGPGGDLFDVFVTSNGKVGIERLEPAIKYLGVHKFDSWAEAQESLPNNWEVYGDGKVNASESNPYEKKSELDKK